MQSEYKIGRDWRGHPIVVYACSRCRTELRSPLAEAGSVQNCPDCGAQFTTPAEKEWGEVKAKEVQAATAAAAERERERKRESPAALAPRRQAVRATIRPSFPVEDHAGPWPPKPRKPFFTLDEIVILPVQHVKIVLHDPDIGETRSEVVDMPGDADCSTIQAIVEQETGADVQKITILRKYWVAKEQMSTLTKGILGLAFLSLFD